MAIQLRDQLSKKLLCAERQLDRDYRAVLGWLERPDANELVDAQEQRPGRMFAMRPFRQLTLLPLDPISGSFCPPAVVGTLGLVNPSEVEFFS